MLKIADVQSTVNLIIGLHDRAVAQVINLQNGWLGQQVVVLWADVK